MDFYLLSSGYGINRHRIDSTHLLYHTQIEKSVFLEINRHQKIHRIREMPSSSRFCSNSQTSISMIIEIPFLRCYTVSMKSKENTTSEILQEGDVSEANEVSKRLDWESSTYGALLFGLEKYLGRLKFTHGFKLNVDPREVDCLIIDKKTSSDVPIDNAIGALFRRHNIVEFKAIYEPLNIDTVWKVISYAAQYKSSGKRVNAISAKEVTITILRVSKPKKLFEMLKSDGFKIKEAFSGVYYIEGFPCMPIQIVAGSELVGDEFRAFRILQKNAKKDDIRRFITTFQNLKGHWKKTLYEVGQQILKASLSENWSTYEQIKKEGIIMKHTWEELMAEEIEEKVQAGENRKAEEIATNMIKEQIPENIITKLTSVTSVRLQQIAASLGLKLVTV